MFSDIKSSISVAKHLPLFKSIKFCINQLQYSNNMFTITVLKFNLRDRPKRECNLFLRKNIFYLTIYGQQRQNGLRRENVTNFARTIERTTPILWHFSKRFITRKNRRRMKKDRKNLERHSKLLVSIITLFGLILEHLFLSKFQVVPLSPLRSLH